MKEIDFVIRTIFLMFVRIAAWFVEVQRFSQSNRKDGFYNFPFAQSPE